MRRFLWYTKTMRSRPGKKRKSRRDEIPRARISCWAATDVGLKREANEDSFLVEPSLGLYLVADGMGGHAGGGTASRMAVRAVRDAILTARRSGGLFDRAASEVESARVFDFLAKIIAETSARIFEESNQRPELSGMGTTLTLFLAHGRRAYVAHVGDSRLYRLRNGSFAQLTEDHSLVNEQVKAGFMTAVEAQQSRFRNIITRSVGFESEVTADTLSLPLQDGDVFLLCSDGLSSMVSDENIAAELRAARLSDSPARLVALAKQGGGDDNITLVVLRVRMPGANPPGRARN